MKNAILLHLHYQDLWPEFWSYLKDIKDENTDLYVTVHTTETEWYNDIKTNATEVFLIENKGQDFGGFLYALHQIKHKDYLTITKLHGKRTNYLAPRFNSDCWRRDLYLPIIGSKEKYNEVCNLFALDSDLFVAGAQQFFWHQCPARLAWIDEMLDTRNIQRKIHISGSMYVFSKKYLDLFFKNKELELYNLSKYGYEAQRSGVLELGHHFECLICNCDSFGGKLKGLI